jgi:hypothetical protein
MLEKQEETWLKGPFVIPLHSQRANFSAIVYIAVRIHVMFDYMNQNIGFCP